MQFWPDPQYFDSPNLSRLRLKHLLKAKAILCPGLKVTLNDAQNNDSETWQFEDGLTDYLIESLKDQERIPETPFTGDFSGADQEAAWALTWVPEGELLQESYVNLIPTPAGGTHTNGLRTGLIEGLREFCEIRNLLPRGLKLSPEDVWERLSFLLSIKLADPQFSGQTKERLSSRAAASFVSGRGQGRLRPVAEQACQRWRSDCPPGHRQRAQAPKSAQAGGPTQGHRRPCPARQAGRLRINQRPKDKRTRPGRAQRRPGTGAKISATTRGSGAKRGKAT